MEKLVFAFVAMAAMSLASCDGNKTNNVENVDADSLTVDTVAVDSVAADTVAADSAAI